MTVNFKPLGVDDETSGMIGVVSCFSSFDICLIFTYSIYKGGPDFFIDMYRRKAIWWHNEHTVWGQVIDPDSLKIIEGIFELPTKKSGLTYLTPHVPIEIE